MGIELELAILLVLQLLGTSFFSRFEVETPVWRRVSKWFFIDTVTIGLYFWLSHWALVLPILATVVGTGVHFWICRKNGFHPIHATPRKAYYRFRGWEWPD